MLILLPLPFFGMSLTTARAILFFMGIICIVFALLLFVGAYKREEERKKAVTVGGVKGIISSLEGMRNNLKASAGRVHDRPKDPPPSISN